MSDSKVGEMQKSTSQQLSEELDKQQEKDPIDVFVNQVPNDSSCPWVVFCVGLYSCH